MSSLSSWRNANPADLDDLLPEIRATDVESAIARSEAAARDWARRPLDERVACLRVAQNALANEAETLACGIAREVGKPLREARGEAAALAAKIDLTIADARRYLAEECPGDNPHPARIRRRAIGSAAVIAPFNFPLHLGHGAACAHLLAGNPVLLKPSPLGAVVAAQYAVLMQPHFPAGVFELVQGGAAESEALCTDPRVRAVCFTGSVAVGRKLAERLASDFGKELALELGGKNAAIVREDADLELAAAAIAEGMCLTAGQRCNATSRVLVHRSVAAALIERLFEKLDAFLPGDPLNPDTRLGPIISAVAATRYRNLVSEPAVDWIRPGASPGTVGGKRGHWVLPAVFRAGANCALPLVREESFAPILGVFEIESDSEALAMHNGLPFGLSTSIFTRSPEAFERLAAELDVANVYANLATTFSPSTLPFGGLGQSGNGRPGGRGFIRFATREQALQSKFA